MKSGNATTPGIFALCYLSYTAVYMARLNFSVAAPLLVEDGIIDKAFIGLAGGMFSFVFAAGKLPSGFLGDRLPSKLLIALGLITTGACNLLIGLMPARMPMLVFWGLNGLGQSLIWGPMLRAMTQRLDGQKATMYGSLLVSSVGVGSLLGLLASAKFAGWWGPLACFLIPGGIVLVLGLLFCALFQEPKKRDISARTSAPCLPLMRDRQFYLMILPAVFHGAIKDNVNLWIVSYYLDCFDIRLDAMANFVFLIPLLGLLGRMLFPLLYRLFGRDEKRVAGISFMVIGLGVIPLCTKAAAFPAATFSLLGISAVISIINSALLSAFPVRFARIGGVAAVASLMDFAAYAGAGISSVVYGLTITRWGYQSMFLSWSLLCAGSIVCILLQRNEKRPAAQ